MLVVFVIFIVTYLFAVIIGTSEIECETMEEVMAYLEQGSSFRHTGSTQMNEQSSRSHSVFTILIGKYIISGNGFVFLWTDVRRTRAIAFCPLSNPNYQVTIFGDFYLGLSWNTGIMYDKFVFMEQLIGLISLLKCLLGYHIYNI